MHPLPRKPPRRGMEAFASRDFRRFQLARVAAVLGYAAQSVAVAWQVYSITHRAIDLGYTGLVQFVPGLLFLLPAGHVADRFDRRQIILVCYGLQVLCTAALLMLTRAGLHGVYPIYLVLFFIGHSAHLLRAGQRGADSSPGSRGALRQRGYLGRNCLPVRDDHWTGAGRSALHAAAGWHCVRHASCRALESCMSLPWSRWRWSLVLVGSMHTRVGRMEHRALSLKVVLAGFQYMGRSPLLLGAASLDLFAVLLGGAVALTPIFANDILHTGPRGLGMLRAAPAAGAVTMSLLMARFPFRRRAGLRLFVCVAIFGAATIVFGFSRSLALSLAALVCGRCGRLHQRHHSRLAAATGNAAGDARPRERRQLALHWRVERTGRI